MVAALKETDMAGRWGSDNVRFVVTFEDGTTELIWINSFMLRTGDNVARLIAGEHRRSGRISNKLIKSVTRAD